MDVEQIASSEAPDENLAQAMPAQASAVADVDELEGRLSDVEDAMAKLQSQELDAAERAIDSLSERVGETPEPVRESAAPNT